MGARRFALAVAAALLVHVHECASSGEPTEPGWVIIGAGKCGTSSLYEYLTAHPRVHHAAQKQIQFFDHQYGKSGDHGFGKYLANFPKDLPAGHVTGEASPGYMAYRAVPGRVREHLPDVKVLAIVRDPAERAWSSYKYSYLAAVGTRGVPLPFSDLLRMEMAFLRETCGLAAGTTTSVAVLPDLSACFAAHGLGVQYPKGSAGPAQLPRSRQHLWRQLVARSTYVAYLERWYATFPEGNVRVVCLESLAEPQSAAAEMRSVAEFVGVGADPFDFAETVTQKYNAEGHKGYGNAAPVGETVAGHDMPEDARALLDAWFEPYNERLFALIGHRCAWD